MKIGIYSVVRDGSGVKVHIPKIIEDEWDIKAGDKVEIHYVEADRVMYVRKVPE